MDNVFGMRETVESVFSHLSFVLCFGIRHNLNMAHSGMGSDEYADKSGMMGYSFELDDLPYMCFK